MPRMRSVARYYRRFHDPWGNKRGNRCGRIGNFQYLLGKMMMPDYADWRNSGDDRNPLNEWQLKFDRYNVKDHSKAKCVLAGKWSV